MNSSLQDIKSGLEGDRAERKQILIGTFSVIISLDYNVSWNNAGALDETRQKMLDFLGAVEVEKWQTSNIRLRQPGTGIWFTDGPELKEWCLQSHSKMWVYGIGKASDDYLWTAC